MVQHHITKEQVHSFNSLLASLDTSEMNLGIYVRRYLEDILNKKKYFIEIYAQVLNKVLTNLQIPKEKITLVDYGAGNGLLGIFAKYLGFGRVILIDILPEFIESAKQTADKLQVWPDAIFVGDIEQYPVDPNYIPDAVVGTDVIEHIYDLDIFFQRLKSLNEKLVTVFTTASNDRNRIKKKGLVRLQQKDEWEGWQKNGNDLAEPSFREVREMIIRKNLQDEDHSVIEKLVTNTRGMKSEDILTACKKFESKGIFPPLLKHPTNTCNPVSGSWTERILTYEEYQKLYEANGFKLRIENGFYNVHRNFPKNMISGLINYFIAKTGSFGNRISPFIILMGSSN